MTRGPDADLDVTPGSGAASEGTPGPGDEFEWRRAGLRAREWTLLRGEEPIAELAPSEWRRFDARGEAGEGVWLFRRRPWRPWVELEVVDSVRGRPVASYRGLGWRRGTLRVARDGRRLSWTRRAPFLPSRTLRTVSGDPVVSVRGRAFRGLRRVGVRVHRADPDLPLLLLVSGYLNLRVRSGGASPTKPFGGGRKGWEPLEPMELMQAAGRPGRIAGPERPERTP